LTEVVICAIVFFIAVLYRIKLAKVKKENASLTTAINDLKQSLQHQRAQTALYEEQLIKLSKQAAMGNMISVIAHQLRQPLNLISLKVQMMGDLSVDHALTEEKNGSIVRDILKDIDFMSGTIDEYRNFFRLEKVRKRFNIKETIEKTLELIKLEYHHLGIDFDLHLQDVIVTSIESELQQVLLNILNNAKDAIVENAVAPAAITIELSHDETSGTITIEDNAGGIPALILPKIFDSYFTTKGEKGTGIGLHMAKVIVSKNLHGKIKVENTQNGARFTLTLPLQSVL
jgi:signal transduction histidine kinase